MYFFHFELSGYLKIQVYRMVTPGGWVGGVCVWGGWGVKFNASISVNKMQLQT